MWTRTGVMAALLVIIGAFGYSQELPNDPTTFGAFCLTDDSWKELTQAPISGGGASGAGTSALTFGIKPVHMVFSFRGAQAPIQLSVRRPTLFLNLPGVTGREFVLVRLRVKKDRRELQVTQGRTGFTIRAGIPKKDLVPIEIKQWAKGLLIIPTVDLAPGEYFLTRDLTPLGYDFGVK